MAILPTPPAPLMIKTDFPSFSAGLCEILNVSKNVSYAVIPVSGRLTASLALMLCGAFATIASDTN
ncbi:Uncharacterised protein [Staphylococcus aureus]|nr:Uncharacterised protein [Staphylococcus aureus]